MKVLFIGGTGMISTAVSRLAVDEGRKTVDRDTNVLIDRIISAYEKGLAEAPA